ncbi:MAG: hypothetical protein AAB847_02495 [Patescibacteria group bacterium]
MKHYDETTTPDTTEDRFMRQRVACAEEKEKRRRLEAGAKLFGWGSECQYTFSPGDDHVVVKIAGEKDMDLPVSMINLYDSRWFIKEA